MPNTPEMNELTLEQLVAFLCGEESISGRWFGEKYEGEPAFWWRPVLKKLLTAHEKKVRIDELEHLELDGGIYHVDMQREFPQKIPITDRINQIKGDE